MGRFGVYPTPTQGGTGYVLDVQADLLAELDTRVVVPLLPPDLAPKPARDLNPVFDINGQLHVMLTQFLAAVPAKDLSKQVSSLDVHRDDIVRALDVWLIGF